LRASGERLRLEEVLPRAIPPDKNSAPVLNRALGRWRRPSLLSLSLLDTNPPAAMRMIAPGRALIGWAQPELRDRGTNTWEEAESLVTENREALEALQQTIERPLLDYQLDYSQGFSLLLPHLAPLKQGARLLSAAAVCEMQRGDLVSAVI